MTNQPPRDEMGAVEEGGKVATSIVDGLKNNPSCLAAILLAAMFALLTFFALQRADQRNQDARMAMLERCFPLDRNKQ